MLVCSDEKTLHLVSELGILGPNGYLSEIREFGII